MNLTRKIYQARNEKTVDCLIGFGGWVVLNVIFAGIGFGLFVALGSVRPDYYYSEGYNSLVSLLGVMLTCLPLLINIGAIIYFALTRYWIALGALVAFTASLLLIICLGSLISVLLFSLLSGADFR
jgi:hypothetical protein